MSLSLQRWELQYDSGVLTGILLYTDTRTTAPDHARAAAVQALLDSASMELVKKYANQLTEWTSTEESDLAKLAERQTITAMLQKACRDSELLIFKKKRKRDGGDEDAPDAKKVGITMGVLMEKCYPDVKSEWELAGGILKTRPDAYGVKTAEITSVDITDLVDLPEPGAAAVSLNATGATLERRQFRHYMLDLAGSLQAYFDKDTLANAESMLARIKEHDASSTRTLSIEGERMADYVDALNTIRTVLFAETKKEQVPTMWSVETKDGARTDFKKVGETSTQTCTINLDGTNKALFIEEHNFTATLFYDPADGNPKIELLRVADLDHEPRLLPLTSENTPQLWNHFRDCTLERTLDTGEFTKIETELVTLSFGTPPSDTAGTKEGKYHSTYSAKFYEIAIDSHRKEHISVQSAKDTAHLFTYNHLADSFNAANFEGVAKIKEGIELVPITDSEIELFTSGEAVQTVHFCTPPPGAPEFRWAIGGCATTLLDGAASAVAFLQHQCRKLHA